MAQADARLCENRLHVLSRPVSWPSNFSVSQSGACFCNLPTTRARFGSRWPTGWRTAMSKQINCRKRFIIMKEARSQPQQRAFAPPGRRRPPGDVMKPKQTREAAYLNGPKMGKVGQRRLSPSAGMPVAQVTSASQLGCASRFSSMIADLISRNRHAREVSKSIGRRQ